MKRQILEVENLSKSFGGLRLFDRVQLVLHEGTITSLFGTNGSGKTTLFNLLGGYDTPDTGTIRYNGRAVRYHHEFDIARAGVGRMWQDPAVFPNHTVLQNLLVSAKNHPGECFLNYITRRKAINDAEVNLQQRAFALLRRFKLAERASHLAGSLTLGEKKLLCIAMLVMNDALLLLLDEPFSGVGPETVRTISDTLVHLRESGKTIFMIEHRLRSAALISDHLVTLANGTLIRLQ